MGSKGQAEIMDGLILMLIAATCAVVLLSISANYGSTPIGIYEDTYADKLAQNTLLSLYHITYLKDSSSQDYRKSIMVAVSRELSDGNTNLRESADPAVQYLKEILAAYHENLGWHFSFALLEGSKKLGESIISSDTDIVSEETFAAKVGSPRCASSALTYPNKAGCTVGGEAGNMCYAMFNICTWQP